MKKASFQYSNNQPFTYKFETESGMSLAVHDREVIMDGKAENMHWHNYFEVEIVYDGKGEHCYDGKTDELGYGVAYIIAPADQHAFISSQTSHLKLYNLRFNENAVYQDVLLPILAKHGCVVSKFKNEKMEILLQQVSLLLKYMSEPSPLQENLIKLMLSQICIFVLEGSTVKEGFTDSQNSTAQIIQDTMWYIRCHFRQKITMQELADRMNYSPNYLANIYKESTGYSCMEYVRLLRVQYASNLLVNTSLSLEDIAYKSGFSSLSHFIMQFHKLKGITPNEYKKSKFSAVDVEMNNFDDIIDENP